MKIVKQVDWEYTLFEDEKLTYILEVLMPAPNGGWATYEKRITLDQREFDRARSDSLFLDRLVKDVRNGKRK
jgi:hypothetical protein